MECINCHIPKKSKQVAFSDEQCALYKRREGPYKSHNTRDCLKFNPVSTPIKKNGGTGSTHMQTSRSNQREREGASFSQIIREEVKKAFFKQSHKRKKCHPNDSESDSDSDYSL